MSNCAECLYTAGQEGGSLTCQRYPQPHRVARSYWCGEHKPRAPEKKKLRATLTVTEPPSVSRAAEE